VNIRWTEAALADLQAAEAYIARHSEQYARAMVERIFDRVGQGDIVIARGWMEDVGNQARGSSSRRVGRLRLMASGPRSCRPGPVQRGVLPGHPDVLSRSSLARDLVSEALQWPWRRGLV